MKNKIFKVWTERIVDETPDLSYLDQKRLNDYYSGSFCFLGVVAFAEIGIPFTVITGKGEQINYYKIEKISSGGLWGIESDSDEPYLKDIEKEQLSELKQYLKQLNVSIKTFNSSLTK
jgi:hypothetical protein